MRHAIALRTALTALVLTAASGALAATIHPDLQALMTGDRAGQPLPVLMVFDDHGALARIDRDQLDPMAPEARCETVLQTLRVHANEVAAAARVILDQRAVATRELYLAGALAFEADADAIEALAAAVDGATLLHDRRYDWSEFTDAATAPGETAPADGNRSIVWNVTWIDADRVWDELGYDGTGVVVGHLDSGVWLSHSDLSGHIHQNAGEIAGNGIDDDGNGYVDDWRGWDFGDADSNPNDDNASGGHGTHTAGTVCGDGSGGTETGVAPGADLLVCKVFDSAGQGRASMVWEAWQYCLEMGVRVMTMSLGVPGDDIPASVLRADRFATGAIRDAGAILFNSAGNEHFNFNPPYEVGMTGRSPAPWNEDPSVPFSSTAGVVTVGGTGYQSNVVYSASSRGPVTWGDVDPFNDWPYNPGNGLIKPDVAAPGTNVNSTVRYGGYSGNTWSGTSMACPHLAGVAALMLQKNPSLSPRQINQILEETALDLGTAGKDVVFGSGLVNAYDAVSAVPTTQAAILVPVAVLPDPTGDEVLDPGSVSPMAFTVRNVSPLVAATNVQATLVVQPNAYVTVVDGAASFADIPAGGETDNVGDPFTLNVASGAPQGFEFTMELMLTCDGGFAQTFDMVHFAGLPDFLTHDAGGVFGTVTDQGIIGYMSDDQTAGDGFGAAGGGSQLFLGSLWAGTSSLYICNRDYHGSGGGVETYEWVTRQSPNGRMRNLGAAGSDQTFSAAFTDSGHASPAGIVVEQTSFAWINSPNDGFVILEYTIHNDGSTTLDPYRAGVFCDWDIADAAANVGSTDADRHAVYLHPSGGGPYYGLALVNDAPPANVSVISNPTYVYPNAAISDSFKARFLSGVFHFPDAATPDDWSVVCSAGPWTLAPGEQVTAAFAMVYGETLEDFLDNVDAAKQLYANPTAVDDHRPVAAARLEQNRPNPFNPQTTLAYEVSESGPVTLEVYDMNGRLVRTLVDEVRAAGRHVAIWNGQDDAGKRVASGVYFATFRSGDQKHTRKMTVVK